MGYVTKEAFAVKAVLMIAAGLEAAELVAVTRDEFLDFPLLALACEMQADALDADGSRNFIKHVRLMEAAEAFVAMSVDGVRS